MLNRSTSYWVKRVLAIAFTLMITVIQMGMAPPETPMPRPTDEVVAEPMIAHISINVLDCRGAVNETDCKPAPGQKVQVFTTSSSAIQTTDVNGHVFFSVPLETEPDFGYLYLNNENQGDVDLTTKHINYFTLYTHIYTGLPLRLALPFAAR